MEEGAQVAVAVVDKGASTTALACGRVQVATPSQPVPTTCCCYRLRHFPLPLLVVVVIVIVVEMQENQFRSPFAVGNLHNKVVWRNLHVNVINSTG